MKRKLVTIQEVQALIPIEGADFIELAKIMGWQCVVKKGDFQVGDKGVYFEVDSFLPIEEKYEFLRQSSYRSNEIMDEGFRIKTQKLRGQISQGLFLPLTLYEGLEGKEIGVEVTELLGVKKWDMPEVEGSDGTIKGYKPFGIPTTDELRAQSTEVLVEKLQGRPYYISTKMDGTSCTIYHKEGKVGVCGRNSEFMDDGKSSMWKYAHNNDIPEKMIKYGKNIALQGEFCGHGIQKNRLRLKEPMLYIFDVVDLDTNEYLGYEEFIKVVEDLGLVTVPIEEVGDNFNYTLSKLLDRAKGKYESGLDKEGIVIRPLIPDYIQEEYNRLSFKVINNDFLVKEK